MSQFAEAFSWCMLQVTLFSLAAACLYGLVVRLRLGGAVTVLISSLAIVGLLTLLCISPWPQWFAPPEIAESDRISLISTDRGPVAAATEQRDQANPLLARRAPIADNPLESELPGDTGAKNGNATILNFSDNQEGDQILSLSQGRINTGAIALVGLAAVAAAIGWVRLLAGMISLRRYLRSSTRIDACEMRGLLTELADGLALRRAVDVRESASLQVAATAGWRRPIILLPAAWREWEPHELRAVLSHELAHVAQRHFPLWVLSQLPLVAHYYQPLVHWLVRRLRLEQELAADALAARVFGGRRQYATVLAGLALDTSAPRGPFTPLGLFMSRPYLMRRIAMLRQAADRPARASWKSRALLLIVLGLAAGIVSGLRTSIAQETDQPAVIEATPDVTAENRPESAPATTAEPRTLSPPRHTVVAPDDSGDEPRGPSAVALFQVSRTSPSLTSRETRTESDAAWEIFCKTQLAKLKSYFVLSAAIRKPEIASLPLIRAQEDPAVWLAKRLDVGFIVGSEIMYIRLSGKRDELNQLTKLVDAVADAYQEEVVWAETQSKLVTRDLLAANLQKLKHELTDKMQLYYDLAREQGMIDSGSGRVAQELDMRRLDRIENELMRLETAQLELETSSQAGNMKFYERRIAQLRERQKELEARVMKRSDTSVDVISRFREIEQLQKIANEMSVRLELMDIEANAPPRIRLLQKAVPTAGGPAVPVPASFEPKK